MTMVNISEPLRNAIVSSSNITMLLDTYKGSYPVFTHRPVPNDAPDISIVISQDISGDHQDGVNFFRPVIVRDIMIYGPNNSPPDIYRKVKEIARLIHSLFHRRKDLQVPGWHTLNVTCTGPLEIPLEDQSVTAAVTVTVTLARKQ